MTKRPDFRFWTQVALLAGGLIALTSLLWRWRELLWTFFSHREYMQRWVVSLGPWGPLVSIALGVVQVLLAPIPGQFVGLLNGYLYGPGLGTLYSMIALLLGTTLAMMLARQFGRPLVERLIPPEKLRRWDQVIDRRGPLFLFLIFLVPVFPDDIICFLIGLSSLDLPQMIVLTVLGRLPGVFVSCWVGAYAMGLPWWALIPLVGGVVALAWTFWRYQEAVENWMAHLAHQLIGRNGDKE